MPQLTTKRKLAAAAVVCAGLAGPAGPATAAPLQHIICPRVCARLSRLVEEARERHPDIVERIREPGFFGSVEEADLIHQYIEETSPGLGGTFVDWLRSRKRIPGASPSGVDLRQLRLVVRSDQVDFTD